MTPPPTHTRAKVKEKGVKENIYGSVISFGVSKRSRSRGFSHMIEFAWSKNN